LILSTNKYGSKKMARCALLAIFIFFIAPRIKAQLPYTNNIYSGNGVNAHVSGTFYKEKIYVASKTSNPFFYELNRFNSIGIHEQTLSFSTDSNIINDNCGKCLQANNNRLYHVIANANFTDRNYLLLFKFPLSLDSILLIDTLWVPPIDFGIDSTEGILPWATQFDSDSTFLITGQLGALPSPTQQYRFDLFLARVDTNFNVLWMKVVPDNNLLRPFGLIGSDIEIDAYGGIVVTGNPYFWSYQTGFAARFRASDGQLLWKKEYTPDLGFGISNMFVVDNLDGSYQYAMNEWTDGFGGVNLVKHGEMDTMGNLLTSHYIGNRNNANGTGLRSNFAQDLIRTHDGNYYIAGLGYRSTNFGYGAKFSRTGDSLWYRQYTHGGWDSPGEPKEQGWIEWFIQKPDSSFLHIGWNQNSYTPVLSTWILNTDKHGCDTLGCETIGLEEFTPTVAFSIYPNPATDYLILQSEQVNAPGTQVRLLDLLGKEVWRAECTQAHYGCKLNLPPLAQGMYQLQLLQENRIVGQEKLILQP
jgi:hypothetical protein